MTGYRKDLPRLAGQIPGWLRSDVAVPWNRLRSRFRPRVALLGGDAHGAFRRNVAIARALGHSHLKADVLVLGPAPCPFPDDLHAVVLPTGDPRTAASQAIQALRGFEPDAVIVDTLPLGLEPAYDPLLRLLRRSDTRTIVALADHPGHAIPEPVQRLCDQIWIYGDRHFHDFTRHCHFSNPMRRKLRHTGHIGLGQEPAPQQPCDLLILFTGGRGADVATLERLIHTPLPPETEACIALDPALPARLRADVALLLEALPHFRLAPAHLDPATLARGATRVVLIGEGADLVDLMAAGKACLPITGHASLGEALRKRGVPVLTPREATPEAIGRWLGQPLPEARPEIDFGALERLPGLLGQLLTTERRKSRRGDGQRPVVVQEPRP